MSILHFLVGASVEICIYTFLKVCLSCGDSAAPILLHVPAENPNE